LLKSINRTSLSMNTFNFVNATFDNLFYRSPTIPERDISMEMVDAAGPRVLFGKSGQNKGDYINIIVSSDEFYEGIIRWLFKAALAREPSDQETNKHMQTFFNDHNLQKIQLDIMKSDEYANF